MPFVGLDLCTVMWSGIDPVNGFHAVQTDAQGLHAGVDPCELSHTYGFLSRPLDPDPKTGKGCSVFWYHKGSSEGFAWLANDPRVQALLPEILPGESFQYGAKGQFVRCHPDGKISMYTTDDATPNGRSVYAQVAPDGFTWVAPWGRITFDATGFHVLHVSGARLDLGAIGGLPAPLNALSSYAALSAQMLRLEGAVVSQGADAGAGEPAAKAPELLAVLQAMTVAIEACTAALTALAAVPVNTAAGSAPAATAAAAVVAAQVALTTGLATIPSSTMVS